MNLSTPNKLYKASKDLVQCCQYHVIICTKYKRKLFTDEIQAFIKKRLYTHQVSLNYTLQDSDIGCNYVHVVIGVCPSIGINTMLTKIKNQLSADMYSKFPQLKSKVSNLWTRRRFISSIGIVDSKHILKFINQ